MEALNPSFLFSLAFRSLMERKMLLISNKRKKDFKKQLKQATKKTNWSSKEQKYCEATWRHGKAGYVDYLCSNYFIILSNIGNVSSKSVLFVPHHVIFFILLKQGVRKRLMSEKTPGSMLFWRQPSNYVDLIFSPQWRCDISIK